MSEHGPTLDIAPVSKAEPLREWAALFDNAYRDGRFFFTGCPTKAGLERAASEGVTLIVDLLSKGERLMMVRFNEAKEAAAKGMQYEHLPMTMGSFTSELVDRFAELLAQEDGRVLVQCSTSNRCGALWAAYLHRHRGMELEDAIGRGHAAGMWREEMVHVVRKIAGEG